MNGHDVVVGGIGTAVENAGDRGRRDAKALGKLLLREPHGVHDLTDAFFHYRGVFVGREKLEEEGIWGGMASRNLEVRQRGPSLSFEVDQMP